MRIDTPGYRVPFIRRGSDIVVLLCSAGYRLVYEVHDAVLVVIVVAVGRRDRKAVYRAAEDRADTTEAVDTVRRSRAAKPSGET